MEKLILIIITIAVILTIFGFVIGFTGLHIETAKGEHGGFVTATETSGLFFKTHIAYIKTDNQSSQEDEYCVVGEEVFKKLKELTGKNEKVTIVYLDWFSRGITNCAAEPAGVIVDLK